MVWTLMPSFALYGRFQREVDQNCNCHTGSMRLCFKYDGTWCTNRLKSTPLFSLASSWKISSSEWLLPHQMIRYVLCVAMHGKCVPVLWFCHPDWHNIINIEWLFKHCRILFDESLQRAVAIWIDQMIEFGTHCVNLTWSCMSCMFKAAVRQQRWT